MGQHDVNNLAPAGPMPRGVRFGTFAREVALEQKRISYNDVIREAADQPRRLRLGAMEIYRVAEPYVSLRLREQFSAVIPLAVYLVLFQLLVLRQDIQDAWTISAGLICVIAGLALFMEGLKVGLMPFGETIGTTLPSKAPLPVVLFIALLLGVGVTFAEPAIGALKAAGQIVTVVPRTVSLCLVERFLGNARSISWHRGRFGGCGRNVAVSIWLEPQAPHLYRADTYACPHLVHRQ